MSRDTRAWMWAEACDLLAQAERLHRQFFRPASSPHALAHWEPPIDVIDHPQELLIAIALPGVAPEHIQVRFEAEHLIVSAVRPGPQQLRFANTAIRRLEIPYGRFERRIALPPGAYRLLEQSLVHGCLELRLAKY